MILNTHDPTPRPQNNRLQTILWVISAVLMCCMCGMTIFAGFVYANSPVAGVFLVLLYASMAIITLIPFKDMKKAYVEIRENDIYVVDYYWGIKKEKHISFSDITSAEIHTGYSHKVKGYRYNTVGTRYIVFKNEKKYLFKIIALPQTEELFQQYL